MFIKSLGRHCKLMPNTFCLNVPNAKSYPELSADSCREACKKDLSCTSGFHFHSSVVPANIGLLPTNWCHLFGAKGAVDKECTGRIFWLESNGFICSGIRNPGRLRKFTSKVTISRKLKQCMCNISKI